MAKVGRWSTTPGSNNGTPPDGWPENQAPSTVNDCAREMMAQIRTLVNDLQYIDQDWTPTYISATTFSVTGDKTSALHTGRRLKVFDATAGVATTIYATITTATFGAVTTITVENDAGQLTASMSSFAVAIISNVNSSIPNQGAWTVSSIVITGNMSISGATVLNGAVTVNSTFTAVGAAVFKSTVAFSVEAVTSATLLNSWVNYSATTHMTAGFFKDPFGVVHLRGIIKNGVIGSSALTLPVGYRPSLNEHFLQTSQTTFAEVYIDSSGNVNIASGDSAYVSLAGITFRVP